VFYFVRTDLATHQTQPGIGQNINFCGIGFPMIRKKLSARGQTTPKPYFAKIDTMESKENLSLNAVPSIDKGGAEDVGFETLVRGPIAKEAGADTWQRLLPSDEAMTILHAREGAVGRGPGFGYWLVVVLVAVSVFWITGGHTLLSGTSPAVDPMLTTGSIAHKNEPAR
jgi:hypothetical protein